MPSSRPRSAFYKDTKNAGLRRAVSSLYEDFIGREPDSTTCLRRFERVLGDFLMALRPFPCNVCGTAVENVAEDSGTELKCPKCGWEPITVVGMEVEEIVWIDGQH